MNILKNHSGFSPAIMIVAFVLVIAAAGGVYYMSRPAGRVDPPAARQDQDGSGAAERSGAASADPLRIEAPDLETGLGLPDLAVSPVVPVIPDFGTGTLYAEIPVDPDLDPDLRVDLAAPVVDIRDGAAAAAPKTEALTAPAVDCSVFYSLPACSGAGAPGSEAYRACKSCFPSK